MNSVMFVRVLGPFAAQTASGAVDLGGPRQRAVLALLLSMRGEVVSVDRLIEDLWRGEPPPRAIASLQAYVSNLRRVLEPDREPRAPARLLVSAPPGYAVRLPADAVDAWRFEALLDQARTMARDEPAAARAVLEDALALWGGPAYAEFAGEPWAVVEAARLDELRLVARELLVDVTVREGPGAAAVAVPQAEGLVHQEPLREEGWRLLALALWSTGRQADALAALRRARQVLADELGLDPGPPLVELEKAILAQRVEMLPTPRMEAPKQAEPALVEDDPFVGRLAELAALGRAAREAPKVVLLTGEAGVGKTSLQARFQRSLTHDGWLVVTGRCPAEEGAPAAWAWVEALRQLAEQAPPPADSRPALAPLLDETVRTGPEDPKTARFRLHRAVATWLRAVAEKSPLAVFIDDLHSGDTETDALLVSVATQVNAGRLLLLAAFRPDEAQDRLADSLATLARLSPLRLALTGLAAVDVERLVGAVTRAPVDPDLAAALTERTGGNPFYVKESAQLLTSEGVLGEVPEGVRDVLRRRLSRLPPAAVTVLRLAAVVGREADVETLIDAADADESAVLDGLEAGLIAGLLTEPAPGRVRFVHELVRATVSTDLSQLRRTRMHARVAAAILRRRPDDLSALAHHYVRAASSDTAALAVDYSVRAAELADRRFAHDTAAELLAGAVAAARQASTPDAELVALLGRLLRAHVRAGNVTAARTTRGQAVEVALQAGRDDLLIAAFTAWTEPTPWQTHPYGFLDTKAVDLLLRLLRRDDLDAVVRCRLLDALTGELEGEDDPRAAAAGPEALAIARTLDDPALLAMALCGMARVHRYEVDVDERQALADELLELATRHGLLSYQWSALHILGTVAAARNDVEGVRRYLTRAVAIAEAYQMMEPLAIKLNGEAMLAHIAGRYDEAERRYIEATERLHRLGSLHALAFRTLALVSVRTSQGRLGEFAPQVQELAATYGPLAADMLAVVLAEAGRLDEARAIHEVLPPIKADYFYTAFLTVRAMAAVRLGKKELAEELIEQLTPARHQLPGVASTALAMRPVAYTLGTLYVLLGRNEEADEHFALAAEVARLWGAEQWV